MAAVALCTAFILAVSLLIGQAALRLLRWPDSSWLAGAAGFAILIVLTPFLLRLPGRALTAVVIVAVLALSATALFVMRRDRSASASGFAVPFAIVAVTVALATIPFVLNDRVGVLGEGIYTNDHAAQLYWSAWLQTGFGPEPAAVQFGYPIGPQAVAVVAAEATGSSLVDSFNGLLLAIPALTGLTALGALRGYGPVRRIGIASLSALPYLAASFLTQSAFKETVMALLVLAFAISLQTASRGRGASSVQRELAPWTAIVAVGLALAVASVFTFSIPGLAWFFAAFAIWFVLEAITSGGTIDWRSIRDTAAAHRSAFAVGALVLIAATVVAIGPAADFIEKIDDVQQSAGRLSSPVFPGEALGIWPEGDYRIVRTEITGALLAVALGAVAASFGTYSLVRRREWALLAMLVAGAAAYLGARLFAEIHVEAKALAVISPLVMLVSLRALLAPAAATGDGSRAEAADKRGRARVASGRQRRLQVARYGFGVVVALAAVVSTLLALRAAPVGFDDRQAGLERLAEEIDGDSVVFLGVDRFAGYYLRETLARAPAGYVPEEIDPRKEKPWVQGLAVDFDTMEPVKLDRFDYAITTTAAYASAPPENFEPFLRAADYVLWRRDGETPRSRIVEPSNAPGALTACTADDRANERPAVATVFDTPPVVAERSAWRGPKRVETAAAGQDDAFLAPATAKVDLDLPEPGEYELSLQYHAQAPLELVVAGEVIAELTPSLDGMYIDGAGRAAFWPAGEFSAEAAGPVEVELRAKRPNGLQRALGVERRVWLGSIAATSAADPVVRDLRGGCGGYLDHYRFERESERSG